MVVITYHSTHGVHRTAQAFCVPPTVDTMKPRSVSEYLVQAKENIGKSRPQASTKVMNGLDGVGGNGQREKPSTQSQSNKNPKQLTGWSIITRATI